MDLANLICKVKNPKCEICPVFKYCESKGVLELKEKKSSTFIIEKAVRGMLPKNRLGRELFRNLFVYEDSNHPHEGQKPKEIKL